MTDARDRLLDVTARLYAEHGYLGTTTRRIAQEADVNEVTLFRHFGSKDALIRAALEHAERRGRPDLDPDFEHPAANLARWGHALHDHYFAQRTLIRRVMGEQVERPEIAPQVCSEANAEHLQLTRYLAALRERGLTHAPFEPHAASAMFLGGLFVYALMREFLVEVPPPEVAIPEFVRLLGQAVGLASAPVGATAEAS